MPHSTILELPLDQAHLPPLHRRNKNYHYPLLVHNNFGLHRHPHRPTVVHMDHLVSFQAMLVTPIFTFIQVVAGATPSITLPEQIA